MRSYTLIESKPIGDGRTLRYWLSNIPGDDNKWEAVFERTPVGYTSSNIHAGGISWRSSQGTWQHAKTLGDNKWASWNGGNGMGIGLLIVGVLILVAIAGGRK